MRAAGSTAAHVAPPDAADLSSAGPMSEPWYRAFFRGDWQRGAAQRITPESGEGQARFIAQALELAPGARVLDTVCGNGRHAVALAKMGYDVTGADLSEVQIDRARGAAADAGVDVHFAVSDMRELTFDGEFDAAINVFTSFGYFEDQEDDRRALRAFRRALRPGGRFFIDYINFVGLVPRFAPQNFVRGDEDTLLLVDHRWDLLAGGMRDTWTLRERDGTERTYESLVRMYMPYELRRELEAAGFHVLKSFGFWDGSELRATSVRLMLVAEAV